MCYELTEEEKMIKDVARRIAEEKVKPVRQELDEKEEFPSEIMKEIASSDLLRVFIPEEYDGLGMGTMGMTLATEEFSRIDGGVAICFAGNSLGAEPIIMYGTEEQKKKYLPKVASGEYLAAFALTEPEAGSDAGNVKTKAVKDGDYYILNGNKVFITNGGEAGIYVVIASTNPDRGERGLSAFIVEKGTPGFSFGKKEKKMGIRSSPTRELVFEDCKVPKENLLGKEGYGFIITMRTFDKTRVGVAAQALGIAQGAFEESLNYAKTRVQFGKKIVEFQGIQFMFADMATQIEAARALVYKAARYIDTGAKNIGKFSAMAKLYASDVAMKVTTDAVQIFGGYGYMKDYPVEKMMRDAKITQIYEGTNQIQRLVIASHLIKESMGRE
ncbi:acyl-CoA dehydrogenase [candidate division WOR-3 bacterium]|nr:acyl-CoA dehydrogenase [candidate division WOR-3 bacterium]